MRQASSNGWQMSYASIYISYGCSAPTLKCVITLMWLNGMSAGLLYTVDARIMKQTPNAQHTSLSFSYLIFPWATSVSLSNVPTSLLCPCNIVPQGKLVLFNTAITESITTSYRSATSVQAEETLQCINPIIWKDHSGQNQQTVNSATDLSGNIHPERLAFWSGFLQVLRFSSPVQRHAL